MKATVMLSYLCYRIEGYNDYMNWDRLSDYFFMKFGRVKDAWRKSNIHETK